jgi:hypothetical protein
MGGKEMKRASVGGYLYVKKSKWIRIDLVVLCTKISIIKLPLAIVRILVG